MYGRMAYGVCTIRAQQFMITRLNGFVGRYFSLELLSLTFNLAVCPCASLILFAATLPDSTQIICLYSSSPKSCIALAFAIHGFHTTVEAEPSCSTRIVRRNDVSRISTVPGVSR